MIRKIRLVHAITILFAFIFLQNICSAQEGDYYKLGFTLDFIDDFETEDSTYKYWMNRFPWGRHVSGQHYYKDSGNIEFENGILNLIAKKEKYSGEVFAWDSAGNFTPYHKDFEYTSGMLYHKHPYDHGYFECKFKVPAVQGTNAAFWLYGDDEAEIDVFEIVGSEPEKAKMTLHWKGKDPITNASQSGTDAYIDTPLFHQDFHVMSVEWDSTDVTWFLDGEKQVENLFVEWQRDRHIPTVPMNIILTLELGTLDGEVKDSSLFPCAFQIDYVASYQKKSTPFPPLVLSSLADTVFGGDSSQVDMQKLDVFSYKGYYPMGHKISLLPGEHYTLIDSGFIANPDAPQEIFVNLIVDNGIDSSAVFQHSVVVKKSSVIANHFPAKNLFYPNPSNGSIRFNTTVNEFKIMDLSGREISSFRNGIKKGDLVILKGINPGLYLLVMQTKKGAFSSPLQVH
ncbi:family 16 glycosylhydrolase [Luteibaculum oceani]|nr:family 16 glycosylhydrolase [Luteibaculum oceani]